jgi:hypothetical protein
VKSFLYTGLLSSLFFLLLVSGIFRHDVPEQEYLNLAKEPQFDCVVPIFKGKESIGSGILISDRYVLSAAHIMIESDIRKQRVKLESGETAIIYQPVNEHVMKATALRIVLKGKRYKAKRLVIYPDYLADFSSGIGDVVLIELEEPFTGIIPATLNFRTNELSAEVTGCGFGASGNASEPETVGSYHKKIAGQNVIDSLGGVLINGQYSKLFCDFDHPTNAQCNRMGSATPRPLEYISAGGDSGGGLFRNDNGKWELIGICSGANVDIERLLSSGYYGQTMAWTRVSVFENWVKTSIQ